MVSKDYYKILELPPSASPVEIKSSYRRLAIKYHPDTNGDNEISHLKFKEIHEAYKVLSNEKERKIYHQNILKKRVNAAGRNTSIPSSTLILDTAAILKQGQSLKNLVAQMDPERMDKQAIYLKTLNLFSVYNIAILKAEANGKINTQLILLTFDIAQYLPYKAIQKIAELLHAFPPPNDSLHRTIDKFVQKQKLNWLWSKYKLLFAFIIAALFCLLIYNMST